MNLDSLTIRALETEINSLFSGQSVSLVRQLDETTIALTVGMAGGGWGHILIGIHPSVPFVTWTQGRFETAKDTVPFVTALRRTVTGSVFTSAKQENFDRILSFHFSSGDQAGPQTLICEIMGHRSNAILVDGKTQTIIDAWKRIPECKNRVRQILPGQRYEPPPLGGRQNPLTVTFAQVRTSLSELPYSLAEGLRKLLIGMSPNFLRLLCGPLCGDIALSQMAEGDWQRLKESWVQLMAIVERANFSPVLYRTDEGETVQIYPLPLPDQQGEEVPIRELGPAMFTWASQALTRVRLRERQQATIRNLQSRLQRLEGEIRRLESELKESEKAMLYRKFGEAILGNLSAITPNDREVTVADPEEEGGRITVPFLEGKTPVATAQVYFARYRQLLRLQETVPTVLERLKQERRHLEDLIVRVTCGDLSTVPETDGQRPATVATGQKARRVPFLRKKLHDGFELWLGRNQDENRRLLRAGKPHDLWFHVKGAPGCHGLLKIEKRKESVPKRVIEQAAQLVAYHSKRRTCRWVEVDYTQVRYVRPIKGRLGEVLYTHFKTIGVTPKQEVLSEDQESDVE